MDSFDDLSPEMKKVFCDEIIKGFNQDTSEAKPDVDSAMSLVKTAFGYLILNSIIFDHYIKLHVLLLYRVSLKEIPRVC